MLGYPDETVSPVFDILYEHKWTYLEENDQHLAQVGLILAFTILSPDRSSSLCLGWFAHMVYQMKSLPITCWM